MGLFRRRKNHDDDIDVDPSPSFETVDPATDEAAVMARLESAGATPAEAAEITALLAQRLSPPEMMAWLTPTEHAHPIWDAGTIETFGVALAWTATNAIDAGKTALVLRSAKLFAAGEVDPLEALPPSEMAPVDSDGDSLLP